MSEVNLPTPSLGNSGHISFSNGVKTFVDEAGKDGAKIAKKLAESVNVDAAGSVADAISAAGATGTIFFPAGDYTISSGLTIPCNVDASPNARLIWTGGTGTAVTLTGSVGYDRKEARLPQIIQNTKTWGGSDIGLVIEGAIGSRVFIREIKDFSVGCRVQSLGSTQGSFYNDIFVGYLNNNKINLDLMGGTTFSANENAFYGGRYHMNSGEGTNVAGARHIRLIHNGNRIPNNNAFFKPSLEGNVPEYHVEIYGNFNTIYNGRWEATTPKVIFRQRSAGVGAHTNAIIEGFDTHLIQATHETDTLYNRITGRYQQFARFTRATLPVAANAGESATVFVSNPVSGQGPLVTVLGGSWVYSDGTVVT